ncbi:hypothetical protein M2404_003962 [Rheinheimera pacifica]|uniref:hypothetical protein n=1 Tax=Rheinheimera pacifica TaxID=173990 RepID=UPI0021676729|nr:hypothetical protein [Rheinheimera pacifica]MCS4309585.1 hypothetical protein [Rheinheimera pacifica]
MILPPREILNNDTHYYFKTEANLSLEHQLKKIIFICKKLEVLLDEQEQSPYWYLAKPEDLYLVESLISNYSILIEYYYSWIIFSFIGTVKHSKSTYKPIQRCESEINNAISKIFEEHSIGTLKIRNIDGYKEICREAFLDAFDFLFVGKFHEIYVINNFLKHNRILGSYAPKAMHNGEKISIPYIYIRKPSSLLLNKSVMKCFFDYKLDSGAKIISESNDYYINLFNESSQKIGMLGGVDIFTVNGIDYIVSEDSVGLPIESMLKVTYDLCSNIIEKKIKVNVGAVTLINSLEHLVKTIREREPKTLGRLLND